MLRRSIGEHDVLISIECRDQKRKATVEWVEQMVMKHAALPTDKLVLISRNGFTPAATAKAKGLGFEKYYFQETTQERWTELLGTRVEGELGLWAFRIKAVWIVLAKYRENVYPAHPRVTILDAVGKVDGTLGQIVNATHFDSPEFLLAAIAYATKEKESVFLARFGRQPPIYVVDEKHNFLEVAMLELLLEAVEGQEALHLQRADYRDMPVAFGAGDSAARAYTLILMQPSGRDAPGAISVVDPTTGAVSTADVKFTNKPGKLVFMPGAIRVPGAKKKD